MRLSGLSARLKAIEQGQRAAAWQALDLVHALVATQERQDADVVALELGDPGQPRHRVRRRPGESLAALCARACPSGSVDASPAPIFADHLAGESEAGEALRLMLGMSERMRAMVAP